MSDSHYKAPSLTTLENSLIRIAVETWRFDKVFKRVVNKLERTDRSRYEGHFNWLLKEVQNALEQSGLYVNNLEGLPFDPGLPATPLNLDEFTEEDELFVDTMIEPVIMNERGIVKTGTITLRKALEDELPPEEDADS
ncbi:MAG: hypothetical protein LBE27_03110 [Deltaproteobacteria bacterium]|jgi:hypothetical protein|nr:hypothetical protein [Deltaproteobacteria bacterium]